MYYIDRDSNPERLHMWPVEGDLVGMDWIDDRSRARLGATISRVSLECIIKMFSQWDYDQTTLATEDITLICPFNEVFSTKERYKMVFNKSNGLYIEMWPVTWEAIVNDVRRRRFFIFPERLRFLFNQLSW